ncbi:MAG: heparinase II/III family protein, partial [Candidatus Ornithomonoglobus sp.]
MDDTEIFSQLNYSEYPGLSKVRLAADRGDYDTAKKELLSYYRQRKAAGTVRAFKITEADGNKGIAELALDNILTGPYELDMPIGRLTVEGIGESAARYYTADVTEKAAAELDNVSFSVMLFGRQKQAYPVIVKAKESGDASMLKVTTTDGAEHIIYADNDTYICAGEADKPHGSESVMYAHEESCDPEDAVGERTRRAYINFPLSQIAGKRIARAELAVKAYVDGGCDTGSKDVFIISIGDTVWSEDTLSWSGAGGSIYSWQDNKSGPPWNSPENSDSEYLNVTARFRFGTPMAYEYLRYIADPEGYPEGEQYGEKLLFLMMAFAEKKEHGFNRTLETGERLSRWVDIIDALVDTPAMTPDIFCKLISFVRGDCRYINSLDIENDAYWWSNWRIVANTGFLKGTEYFPEFNTYREFREKAEANVEYCMELLYNADMSFKEAGPAYALWCAELFCDCAETAEQNGHPMRAEIKEKLKYAARFAMESFYPDGYDSNIGDSNYINKLGSFKRLADFLGDDALAAYASGGREGSPDYLSSYYSDANSAFMRNSWNPDNAVYVSFLNNPYDGHSHPDSNQTLMYAYGSPLLVDSGRYSYSSYNDIYNRLRTAAAHNTIEVVGMPLAPHSAAAKPFTYHISNKAFEFNTSVQTGYEGIAHTRNVLFMYDGYAIVTDHIESS